MKINAFDGLLCLLALLFLGVTCVVTHGCKQEAEEPISRFESADLARFTIKRETTPGGYPNLYLIHDGVTGQDMLYVQNGGEGCAAGFMLGQKTPPTSPFQPTGYAYLTNIPLRVVYDTAIVATNK